MKNDKRYRPYTPSVTTAKDAEIAKLKAQRDELLAALSKLESVATMINARQHAGNEVWHGDWSELYHACIAARAAIAKAGGGK